ncbi:flotillin family protein [soil metagenome]
MNQRLSSIARAVRRAFDSGARSAGRGVSGAAGAAGAASGARGMIVTVALVVGLGYLVWKHPPVQTVERGEVGVRVNQLTGKVSEHQEGTVWVVPGLQSLRRLPLRDQIYSPTLRGEMPFQSIEGLSFGMDLAVRYALDPAKIAEMSRDLPDDIGTQVVQPEIQGVIYQVFARYTVREIFSTKRAEIQQVLEAELKPKLAADGIVLKAVQTGKVVLPDDYRRGMDKLIAEELETAKMRYTLELKEKRVQETALEGEADLVRREKAANAAASEQLIAAKAQEEAMKHVLPFKQKQIEQRQLEAEADKVARIKQAEANAQARRVEAAGEADSRQKLADAEVYRLEKVGRANTEQMSREGVLLSRHPLLIQKTLADKLSDKISVIIAPAPTDGSFIGASLLGKGAVAQAAVEE